MSAMYNLRLPASEMAKLTPSRTRREHPRAASEDLVRAGAAEDDVVIAPVERRRPANHLSGFARA
jgi:hypothetical protein